MEILSYQYRFREKNELYVYVEKFNTSAKEVLIDFVDSFEFGFFNLVTGFNYDWERMPTMMQITGYNQKRLKEGSVYRISRDMILQLAKRIVIVEYSLVIGFYLELFNDDPEIFGKPKTFSEIEKFDRNIEHPSYNLEFLKLTFGNSPKVNIRKIGQGSWNEILDSSNKYSLVFDAGTIYTTSRNNLMALIGNRDNEYQLSKPNLILSHWDVDHYHFLLGFQDNTIKSFQTFVYRNIIPNLTARKALGRFSLLNNSALTPIAPESPPHPKKSSTILRSYSLSASKEYVIFNGSRNRSRNKSGIGMAIRKKDNSVIFSGDYDYSQVSTFVLPELNYNCYQYLIVPHHGGNAGKFIYNSSKANILKEAIISVGKNPYKPMHPYKKNIDELKKIGFKIVRTDNLTSDYLISL